MNSIKPSFVEEDTLLKKYMKIYSSRFRPDPSNIKKAFAAPDPNVETFHVIASLDVQSTLHPCRM